MKRNVWNITLSAILIVNLFIMLLISIPFEDMVEHDV
jgi:hypothetical protein